MRIAFMGKGGSGKTTVAAGLTRYLSRSSSPVLAVDGDLNMHLAGCLEMTQRQLHRERGGIAGYLEPELSKQAPIIGVTPPTRTSRFLRLSADDEFLRQYATWSDDGRIALLTVGTYESGDAGTQCYHGKLSVAEMILHRTLDQAGQWIISDSTAGIDSIGTSLYFASDVNIFLIEPTLKSVRVFSDFSTASEQYGLTTYVIANKVKDDADRRFVDQQISSDRLLGHVPASPALRQVDQGACEVFEEFVEANEALWKSIVAITPRGERNWDHYLRELRRVFKENCDSWYNDYYQRRLDEHIDTEFSYASVAAS